MDVATFLRPTGLDANALVALGNELQRGNRYRMLRVKKRHGGFRSIAAPDEELKATLKLLRLRLQSVISYDAPQTVFGYVPGRGILGNASCHLGQPVVLCVDLVDFFGTIGAVKVSESLLRQGLDRSLVDLLLLLVVVNGSLPPGFSTSPLLSNIVFEDTDIALSSLATERNVRYSRYADDLTFSGSDLDDGFLAVIDEHLKRHGWAVNTRKTRFMRRGGPQYVTGLYVGDPDRPHIPRRVKRRIRAWFHYIALYGYADCDSVADLPSVGQLLGWVRHVNQVNPEIVRSITRGLYDQDWVAAIEQLLTDPTLPPHDDWDEFLLSLRLPPDR